MPPLQTSPEHPVPVRVISQLLTGYIGRLGAQWIEGQVTQLSLRPGTAIAFVSLRDPAADMSLTVTCHRRVLEALPTPLAEGARIVVHAKAQFYPARGTLSFAADEIRPVGIGELLARIEHLRRVLAAEGLFAAERKRRLPFLPHAVGLICGRGSAAERDVLENARRRWPAVRFRVEAVPVQGPQAVAQVCEALDRLEADPEVDVIVIARGGGSVEDLLPFSDERLLRQVASCFTPVVSAIGHEPDSPLLDLVADVRASTPTDAGKRVVPDIGEELAGLAAARQRLARCVLEQLAREQRGLDGVRARPALADPFQRIVGDRARDVHDLTQRAHRALYARLDRADDEIVQTLARVRGLSPLATLERGYAVVQRESGEVVRAAEQVQDAEQLRVRLARGELTTRVTERVLPSS